MKVKMIYFQSVIHYSTLSTLFIRIHHVLRGSSDTETQRYIHDLTSTRTSTTLYRGDTWLLLCCTYVDENCKHFLN